MAIFSIDGRVFSGRSVIIRNDAVIIDGKTQDGTLYGVVEIRITEGVLASLETDVSVHCGAVAGNVVAGGSVNCESVGGNVQAGGSVNCGPVQGAVMAGGSVRHGR